MAFITEVDLAEGIWFWVVMEEVQGDAEALDALLCFAWGAESGDMAGGGVESVTAFGSCSWNG